MFANIITKEEAHWASFRSAVGNLQQTLLMNNLDDAKENEVNGQNTPQHAKNTSTSTSMKQHDAKQNIKLRNHAGDIPSSNVKEENSRPDTWAEEDNDETYQNHQQYLVLSSLDEEEYEQDDDVLNKSSVELTGLEEVNKSMHSMNNVMNHHDLLRSPATTNALSRTESHNTTTTNALSVAEQKLAETRLKLAMTESERDELEFQLIQRR